MALDAGAPFLFKLHAAHNVVAGGGFYVRCSALPVRMTAFTRAGTFAVANELVNQLFQESTGEVEMVSPESRAKDQFAKIFALNDWRLFKAIADENLKEAVYLRKADFDVPRGRQLLMRNIRKRLLIGIGIELLLKAAFLKAGFCITHQSVSKATSA